MKITTPKLAVAETSPQTSLSPTPSIMSRRALLRHGSIAAGAAIAAVAVPTEATGGNPMKVLDAPETGAPGPIANNNLLQSGTKEVDPIFAAIEQHRAIQAAFTDAVRREFALEAALPPEKTRSRIHFHESVEAIWEIVETDDPDYIAAIIASHRNSQALGDFCIDMLEVKPTTLSGVVALLAYASQGQVAELAPDGLDDDEDKFLRDLDWSVFVMRQAAEALGKIIEGKRA